MALALAAGRRLQGRRIAVLSDGGGHATHRSGLCRPAWAEKSARFSTETTRHLREAARCVPASTIPSTSRALQSPIPAACHAFSTCASPIRDRRYRLRRSLRRLSPNDGSQSDREAVAAQELDAAKACVAALRVSGKPFFLHTASTQSADCTRWQLFSAAGIPVYGGLEVRSQSNCGACDWVFPLRADEAQAPHRASAISPARVLLGNPGSPASRRGWHCRACVACCLHRGRSARGLLCALGPGNPVVLKLVSQRAIHKSDVGACRSASTSADATAEDISAASDNLPQAR